LLATEIDPKMAIAFSTLALTYEALDNLRLARDSYEKAIRAEPSNFEVQNTYAVFLCRQREFEMAEKHFDKAMNHPENDDAEVTMTNAGVCMGQKPDLVAAEKYFRLALDRKRNYGEALLQLCLLKYQQKDYLSARAFLQRFMSSSISTAGVLYLAAKIEDELGNDRGRTDFEDQLIRQFPTSPEARKVLGAG
jgi:type IV pilus assembly protein PilF